MATIWATAGAVILSRRGSKTIGWIFLAFGFLGPLQQLGISYASTCVDDPGSCYLGLLVVVDGLWFLTVVLGLGGLFLLFPDGRLPKGRGWLAVSLLLAGLGSLALVPFTPELYHLDGVPNPWSVDAPQVMATIDEIAGVVVFLLAVTAIIDFAWRARQAEGLIRLQNRWLTLAGLLTVLGGAFSVVGEEIGVDLGWAWSLGTATIPLAVTMAITRHRLYDIDRCSPGPFPTRWWWVCSVWCSPPGWCGSPASWILATHSCWLPARLWRWQRCSTRCVSGFKAWSTASSTALAMTSNGLSTCSSGHCGTGSTLTAWWMTGSVWSVTRCNRRRLGFG